MESLFAECLNGLLQQNLPYAVAFDPARRRRRDCGVEGDRRNPDAAIYLTTDEDSPAEI
jgi:hypothetical protein